MFVSNNEIRAEIKASDHRTQSIHNTQWHFFSAIVTAKFSKKLLYSTYMQINCLSAPFQ